MPITVLLASTSTPVAQGLRRALHGVADISIVAESRDVPSTLDRMAKRQPDVMVIDMDMLSAPGGGELNGAIRRRTGATVFVDPCGRWASRVPPRAAGPFLRLAPPLASATPNMASITDRLLRAVRDVLEMKPPGEGDEDGFGGGTEL
jgi:hypothetical protein